MFLLGVRRFLASAHVHRTGGPGTGSPTHGRGGIAGIATALFLLSGAAGDALALRIQSYNLLNYAAGREAHFRLVLQNTAPDVLIVEEVSSISAVNLFLTGVLEVIEPGQWVAGPFVDGPDTNNAIYYRPSKVEMIGHFTVPTALRNIDEWTIRPVGYVSEGANARIYAVHLKASQGTTEEQQRLAEVMLMRQRMETFPPGQSYLVTGDFNIYTSAEPAYQYLLGTSGGLSGIVQDPIDTPGVWHNQAAFAPIHTQSPRTAQFGGGANGGMDDRFDMMLVGPAVQDEEGFDILEDTYTAYGQDGLHFNLAIIDPPPNEAVPPEVAQALHDASDHLPIFADFQLPARIESDLALDLGTSLVGGTASALLSVANPAEPPADDLDYTLTAPSPFLAPAGSFSIPAGMPDESHVIQLDTGAAGAFAGSLVIASDAVDEPVRNVALTGTVLDHAVPSVSDIALALTDTLDFGTHAPGEFPTLAAVAANFGYDALQGLLDVHSAAFDGDECFAIDGGFTDQQVGATPASWPVIFDDLTAPEGMYTGTLTLATRDQPDLSGALDLAPLVYTLIAVVDGDPSGTPELPGLPLVAGFDAVHPNPFATTAEIRFGLTEAGNVHLAVFDAGGRMVRTLAHERHDRGRHAVLWDGDNENGQKVAAGVYYLRLTSSRLTQTRPIVRVR